MTMKIDELPRKAVLGYLELTRLPLTATERVLRKTEGTWAPTIAVDRLQARMKELAGSALRDDTLVADARLQNAALDERLRAAEEEARADRIRGAADSRLENERDAADAAEREVRARADQREQAVEHAAQAKERQVREKAAEKKAAARKVEQAQHDALEQREAVARREVLKKESKALNDQRAAAEAKAEVLELQDKLDEVKAVRKRA
jgi:hypothetical protein